MEEDKFDTWTRRAETCLAPMFLPTKFFNSDSEVIRIIAVIFSVPWVILIIPLQLFLIFPAIICLMMANTYIGE